jgi:hypothetical protein
MLACACGGFHARLHGSLLSTSCSHVHVGAGIVNLLCIRQKELTEGVTIYDKYDNQLPLTGDSNTWCIDNRDGFELGQSIAAGKDALAKCGVARALYAAVKHSPLVALTHAL